MVPLHTGVSVLLDGRTLVEGRDFTVDPWAGTVTLLYPTGSHTVSLTDRRPLVATEFAYLATGMPKHTPPKNQPHGKPGRGAAQWKRERRK